LCLGRGGKVCLRTTVPCLRIPVVSITGLWMTLSFMPKGVGLFQLKTALPGHHTVQNESFIIGPLDNSKLLPKVRLLWRNVCVTPVQCQVFIPWNRCWSWLKHRSIGPIPGLESCGGGLFCVWARGYHRCMPSYDVVKTSVVLTVCLGH